MTKAEKFNKDVEQLIATQNPEVNESPGYQWEVKTPLGNLEVSVHEPKKRAKLFSVFMKFEDVDKAKKQVDCNPHSGKWNIHTSSPKDSLDTLYECLVQVGISEESLKVA